MGAFNSILYSLKQNLKLGGVFIVAFTYGMTMPYSLVVKNALVYDGKPLVDIGIDNGKITKIGSKLEGEHVIDVNGDAVVPTFIETHIHLDKALLERVKPNREGTLAGAIKTTGELKKAFQDDEVYTRSKIVLDMLLKHGTTIVRCWPDTDPLARLVGFKAMLRLKEEYKDFVDLTVGAFAQEGLVKAPGAYEILDEALKLGGDLVGGCPYNENNFEDTKKHIDQIFQLGKKYNVDIGFHADFGDDITDMRFRSIDYIIKRTVEEKYQGRVSVGHMTSLSSVDPKVLDDTIKRMASAKINLVSLPATDLFLSGRGDVVHPRRGVLFPTKFIKGGVNHTFSTNNVQNGFTPFAKGDLLLIGAIYEHVAQLGTIDDQKMLLDMITTNAAKTLHIEKSYGLEAGKNADLVVLGIKKLSDIFIELPIRRYVIKRGRVIYRSEMPELKAWT
jgi:cytosine/creatinine deaminase